MRVSSFKTRLGPLLIRDANEIGGIDFDIQSIGGVKKVNVEWWTVDNGVVVDTTLT